MMDRFNGFNSGRMNFFLLTIITVILFGAVLKVTSVVVVPFIISWFLAIVASPMVRFLEKHRVPRIISVAMALFLLFACLFFMGMILFSYGRSLLEVYPKYEARLSEIYIWIARFFELPYDEHLSFFDNIWGQIGIRNRVRVLTLSFSNAFFSFLKDAFMVSLFLVFLLLEAVFFKEKLDKAFEGPRASQIKKIISDVMLQVTRYLSMKIIISLGTGIMVGIGLKIIGVEFAIIWAVLQFVFNFIPNIGSIAVGMLISVFSLAQFWPDPMPALAAFFVLLVTNMLIGSVLEPKIMGDRLGLSPLVVLVSLLIWGWLWGFAGFVLAVPMTAIIKIACENIPVLEPISILLGSRKAALAVTNEENS